MKTQRLLITLLAGSVLLSACKKDPPPTPAPVGPSPEELAQMRQDSIEAARAAEEEARRREAERQAELERQRLAAEREREREGALSPADVETLREMVFFEYDQSRITREAERTLRAKVEVLRSNPDVRIRIEGHADERGSTEYNLALGQRRAQSVMEFLSAFGLSASRFNTISYGEERPLVHRADEAAWSRNRRVEFVITDGAGRTSGGR